MRCGKGSDVRVGFVWFEKCMRLGVGLRAEKCMQAGRYCGNVMGELFSEYGGECLWQFWGECRQRRE